MLTCMYKCFPHFSNQKKLDYRLVKNAHLNKSPSHSDVTIATVGCLSVCQTLHLCNVIAVIICNLLNMYKIASI